MFCLDFQQNPRHGRSLLLHGNNGAGKTHSAKRVVSWANRVELPEVVSPEDYRSLPLIHFVHWPTFVSNMFNGNWDAIKDCEESNLLVLDEIGGENDSKNKVGMEKLARILNNEHQWRIITTNLLPEEWERQLDRRVTSRLFRNCIHVDLTDVPDFNTI